jgi:carboxymethylenebutenolidase
MPCATTARNLPRPASSASCPTSFGASTPGVELSDGNPEVIKRTFDLYCDFDYDDGVRDIEDSMRFLQEVPECSGKAGAVGYGRGGKLCFLLCCRTEVDCAAAYCGAYIEHTIREAPRLHRPFMLHLAMHDRWVQAEVNELLERRASPDPLASIDKYPGADHAFARRGGKTWGKPEADRALGLALAFFKQLLGS